MVELREDGSAEVEMLHKVYGKFVPYSITFVAICQCTGATGNSVSTRWFQTNLKSTDLPIDDFIQPPECQTMLLHRVTTRFVQFLTCTNFYINSYITLILNYLLQ